MVLIKKEEEGFYPAPSHLKPFNKMLLRMSSLNSVLSRMYSSEKTSSFLGRLYFSKPTACNLIANGESAIETTHWFNDSFGGIPKKAACNAPASPPYPLTSGRSYLGFLPDRYALLIYLELRTAASSILPAR